MKRKINNIFIEVISNTKIFFNEGVNDQYFVKHTGGLDKGGFRQRRIQYIYHQIILSFNITSPYL